MCLIFVAWLPLARADHRRPVRGRRTVPAEHVTRRERSAPMCLIFVAWQRHARHRLVVAANRDEHHARPALPVHWWDDAPGVLAGRDLEAGGTWLGVGMGAGAAGRFAAITNYRDPFADRLPAAPSRGALVSGFVAGDEPAEAYLGRVMAEGHRYNGFSLLAMDGDTLAFASNRSRGVVRLDPGVYGLSNHLLDTPWPRVTGGKAELERLLAGPEVQASDLLALLAPDGPRHDEAPVRQRAAPGVRPAPGASATRRSARGRHRKRPRTHAVARVTVHHRAGLRNAGIGRHPARRGRRRGLRGAELRCGRRGDRRRHLRARRGGCLAPEGTGQ